MTINRLFIAFAVLVGIAAGILLVAVPHARDFRVSPYFWVLLAILTFDLIAYARGRGAPGTMIAMEARVLGFVLAVLLSIFIPILAGSPGRLF
jgi:hypothetical protein